MKEINRNGPAVRGLGDRVPPFGDRDRRRCGTGRRRRPGDRSQESEAFAAGHPSGALNIGAGPRIGFWAGWLVPPAMPLVLLGVTPARPPKPTGNSFASVSTTWWGTSADSTSRSGGGKEGGSRSRDDRRARAPRSSPAARAVDARRRPNASEWLGGHIDEAINIPVGDLPGRADELRGPTPSRRSAKPVIVRASPRACWPAQACRSST